MTSPKESPYITEWIPYVGGFRPAQEILQIGTKCFQPRKHGKFVTNSQWLQNEVKRLKEAGIDCYIEEKFEKGQTMLAIKKMDKMK